MGGKVTSADLFRTDLQKLKLIRENSPPDQRYEFYSLQLPMRTRE